MNKVAVVKTRRMTIEDVEEVFEVEKKSFPVPWSIQSFLQEIQNNKFARYVVAEVDGKIIGYGGMWNVAGEGHITNIAIHPDFRGRGYGNDIVHSLIQMAKKEDVLKMTLEVRESNVVAQKLYRKYGFVACGVRYKYYQDNNEDAIIMWRE